MKFLGFTFILFFGIVAFATILVAGIARLISQSLKDVASVFKGDKTSKDKKTYYYGTGFKRDTDFKRQMEENVTIIDAEIVKDSLLKPYIADVKEINKNFIDEEIKIYLIILLI